MIMKITSSTPLLFKYLALPFGIGGRGGVQRFFLLSQNIPFEEELFTLGPTGTWSVEKERVVTSGDNPSGGVPIIYAKVNENEKAIPLPQHVATCRYIAAVHGCTSGDPYQDYVQDMVADEYQNFRNSWAKVAFSGTEEQKSTYKKEELPKQLIKFNSLYKQFKTHDVFLSVSTKSPNNPLWGDAAIFGLLRDHVLTGLLTLDSIETSYPELHNMYQEYLKIPAINEWCTTTMKEKENTKENKKVEQQEEKKSE